MGRNLLWRPQLLSSACSSIQYAEAFQYIQFLNDNIISCIVKDMHKNIWIASTNGLYQYTQEDGISHNEFNQYAYCKGSNNILYFDGLDGITYFEPFWFIENPFSPQPSITGLSILNQPVTYVQDGISQMCRDSKGNINSIVFPFSMRQFNIQYTVSNYLSGKRNAFAYMLEGFDRNWHYTTDRNISYSNLLPGKYVFKVKACNNNGKWCDTPTEFLIYITPIWYQTWITKVLFILLF